MTSNLSPYGLQAEQQALVAVLEQLLSPLAKLCLAKGISIQAAEEVMRRAYVEAATEDCDGLNPSRLTSRISTMTGLTRREVARLQSEDSPVRPQTRTVATDVLTSWASQSEYVNKKGLPIRIPRTGEAPSFEALAACVTKDVHPKSVLADMVRLGLVTHNEKNDTVTVVEAIFVPKSDWPQMVGFIGTNVGDHMQASVDNVLHGGGKHFEQALLADELSQESLEAAKSMITAQWRDLLTQLGPQLQALMEQDKALGRTQNQQLRIGLYSYMSAMHPDQPGPQGRASKESHENN
ncbi:MAG: DUF6502 family protein [Betaproteobacteria bacterium]